MKSVLIVSDDPPLAHWLQEKLEASGARGSLAPGGEVALQQIQAAVPDLVVLDTLLPDTDGGTLAGKIRAMAPNLPMLVLAAGPRQLITKITHAGARTVPAGNDPLGQALGEIAKAVGLPETAPLTPPEANKLWSSAGMEPAEALAEIRRDVHALVKQPQDAATLDALLRSVHRFSNRTWLAGHRAAAWFTMAFEELVLDLDTFPESVNASILQTASQAVDFLATVFEEQNLSRLVDPANAQVFAVDDEPTAREQIVAALKLVNVHTSCAGDGETALAALEDNPFDLILLDVNLPDINGFDLCTQARQFPDHGKTPVVFITGMSTFTNRAKATLSGGNDFIAKPFNLPELGLKALMWIFRNQLGLLR